MARKRQNRKRRPIRVGRTGRPTRTGQRLPILVGLGILLLIAGLAGWLTIHRAMAHYAKYGHVYIPNDELFVFVMLLFGCAIVVVFSMVGRNKRQ